MMLAPSMGVNPSSCVIWPEIVPGFGASAKLMLEVVVPADTVTGVALCWVRWPV